MLGRTLWCMNAAIFRKHMGHLCDIHDLDDGPKLLSLILPVPGSWRKVPPESAPSGLAGASAEAIYDPDCKTLAQ